mgnify:FL=1
MPGTVQVSLAMRCQKRLVRRESAIGGNVIDLPETGCNAKVLVDTNVNLEFLTQGESNVASTVEGGALFHYVVSFEKLAQGVNGANSVVVAGGLHWRATSRSHRGNGNGCLRKGTPRCDQNGTSPC